MHRPARLVVERGEERIMHSTAYLYDGASDIFAEARLVAYLFTQSDVADENDLLTQNGDLENLA